MILPSSLNRIFRVGSKSGSRVIAIIKKARVVHETRMEQSTLIMETSMMKSMKFNKLELTQKAV